MAKIVVALLVLTLSALTAASSNVCNRCKYVKKHTHYPARSTQLKEVIDVASKKLGVNLSLNDKEIIHKIVYKENRTGSLTAINNGCYGLGQGKKSTYLNSGVPWKTKCPVEQVMMIIIYVKGRYKTFDKAWKHHKARNWY
jgi:hypothetical protein